MKNIHALRRGASCRCVIVCARATAGAFLVKLPPWWRIVRAFEKPTFGSGQLFDYLRSSQCFEQIELCGLVTNMCVLSNAVLAKCAQPEVRIVVDAAACAAPDQEMHQAALKVLEGLQVEVINKK